MKKILLGAVALGAIAGGVYLQQSNSGAAQINMAQLDYVPADTVFFASQLAPFPYEQYSKLLPQLDSSGDFVSQYEELQSAFEHQTGQNPNAAFLMSLLGKYEHAIYNQKAGEVWGVGSDIRYLSYAIGMMPVFKLELAQPQNFIDTLKASADEAGLSYEEQSLNDVNYTRFKMQLDDMASIDIVAAIQGQWLTLTLDSSMLTSQDDLAIALATKKPEVAMSSTTRLQDYLNKYGWDGSSVNFINNQAMVSALVGENASRMTQMLDTLLVAIDDPTALDAIRTPGCKTDLPNIAAKFPALVWGTSELEITDDYANFDADFVIESSDTDLLGAMSSIRGFIPSHITDANTSMLSFGYGIDVSKVSPFVNTVWQSFTTAEFKCEPLVMAQQQAKQANPMALMMATGMFAGIKGVSVSINDLSLDLSNPDMPNINEFNGIITLSADDPMTLINTAKSLVPELANVEIKDDGTAISLSDYAQGMALPIEPKLAVNGNHITLYSGEKAEQTAKMLKDEKLEANGLIGMAMQLEPFMKLVVEASEATGEDVPPELKSMAQQNISTSVTTDITKHGIQLSSTTHIRKN